MSRHSTVTRVSPRDNAGVQDYGRAGSSEINDMNTLELK